MSENQLRIVIFNFLLYNHKIILFHGVILNFLYYIIISPIEAIVEWVFNFVINKISFVGVIGAVLGVSIVINFLALPLYNIADRLQEKERNIAKFLEFRVKKIKKAFKGDEQFMMLSEYYRQNNYHPLYVLRSSLSILIEIPFFIAAYHYLSNNEALKGASFWIFNDLGAPDEFFSLRLGSFVFGIHILPILMTVINFISGAIYTKNATFREKVQLYVVAVIFLVLLYNSPSGLVIYWILNNVFSLFKNIVMKTKKPARIAHFTISVICWLVSLFVLVRQGNLVKKSIIVCFSVFVTFIPVFSEKISAFFLKKLKIDSASCSLLVFSGLGLAFLLGFTLPSSVIATSPVEFSFLGSTKSPVSYICSSFFVFFGFFVFWPCAIYKMFGERVKKVLPGLFFILFVCALANVYLFKYTYGNLSVSFTLENDKVLKNYSLFFMFLPLLVAVVALLLYFIAAKKRRIPILNICILSIVIAETGLGVMKTTYIKKSFAVHAKNHEKNIVESSLSDKIEKIYHLSRNKNNIIVLFLDRAINSYFPKFLDEYPDKKEAFSGFVYFPNTLSFSTHTSLASPAMMGGYEYTPSEINTRKNELLREKHNEAILMLPKIFMDAGYSVTVTDPPWCNYAHEQDLTPFEKYPQMKAYSTFGKYTDLYFKEIGMKGGVVNNDADKVCRKEIRNFIVLQSLYPPLRSTFYRLCTSFDQRDDRNYYNIFSSLYYLDKQTDFTSEINNYLFIDSDTPHEPHNLTSDLLKISEEKVSFEQSHYKVNAAALNQVSKFLNYLKDNGVYDNTRIIIVADHGAGLNTDTFRDFEKPEVPAYYNPLLLFKDFNSNGELKSDYAFMTNADTPFLATKNIVEQGKKLDMNPFTGKKLVQQKKDGVVLYPLSNGEHHADQLLKKSQFTLDEERGWYVKDNIFVPENWTSLLEWKKNNKGENK